MQKTKCIDLLRQIMPWRNWNNMPHAYAEKIHGKRSAYLEAHRLQCYLYRMQNDTTIIIDRYVNGVFEL